MSCMYPANHCLNFFFTLYILKVSKQANKTVGRGKVSKVAFRHDEIQTAQRKSRELFVVKIKSFQGWPHHHMQGKCVRQKAL